APAVASTWGERSAPTVAGASRARLAPAVGSTSCERPAELLSGASNSARSTSGAQRSSASSRKAEAIIFCSWVKVKSIASRTRQPEQALGDDVPLDLVGPRVDGTREREDEAVEPPIDGRSGGQQLRARAEQTHGSPMQAQIELGPEDLVEARFATNRAA